MLLFYLVFYLKAIYSEAGLEGCPVFQASDVMAGITYPNKRQASAFILKTNVSTG
jgi:hypothetical protein